MWDDNSGTIGRIIRARRGGAACREVCRALDFSDVVRSEVEAAARNFALFVPAERTAQLASTDSCPYTDFAADSHRSSRVIPCDPAGTYAAERACLRRQSSLIQVISSESCILLPASFPLGRFWRSISGPTVPRW